MFNQPSHQQIADVEVRTPSGTFTWKRGPLHTVDDVAEAARRRFWPTRQGADSLQVVDESGRCLRHTPLRLHRVNVVYVIPEGQ